MRAKHDKQIQQDYVNSIKYLRNEYFLLQMLTQSNRKQLQGFVGISSQVHKTELVKFMHLSETDV